LKYEKRTQKQCTSEPALLMLHISV